VLADVDNSWRVAQEEIFGPVACVIPFEDEDEAIRIAKRLAVRAVGFGVDRRPRPGHPGVEGDADPGDLGQLLPQCESRGPRSGYKRSGMGREMGMHAVNLYTEVKNVCFSSE
jgi:acyl-CoA reductase-like NAD-dependent aldehyde dehydrogenase